MAYTALKEIQIHREINTPRGASDASSRHFHAQHREGPFSELLAKPGARLTSASTRELWNIRWKIKNRKSSVRKNRGSGHGLHCWSTRRVLRWEKGKNGGVPREFPRNSCQEDATPCRSARLQLMKTPRPATLALSMP